MIEKSVCEEILTRAMKTGADFAEIFCSDKTSGYVSMIDKVVENAGSNRDRGVGIRLLSGRRCVYAYGNDLSQPGLLNLADSVAAALSAAPLKKDILLTPSTAVDRHTVRVRHNSIGLTKKTALLKELYFAANDYADEIVQCAASYSESEQAVLIANSDGLYIGDRRTYTRIHISAIASNGSENQSGSESPGAYSGLEFFDTIDLSALGRSAARCAVTMLHAEPCPAGRMPVVMGNGFGGVIFHEACGHALEATSVGKGNSVFCDKLGAQIAHAKVTALDDATLPNNWGSLNISDEGEPTQKIVLIENGILKNYMIDKLGARRLSMPSTGSGRRQSYHYTPTSRMSNTYIAAGTDSAEEIIGSVDKGLYAAKMGGGSVNPATGEFNFAVSEGYLIVNGKLGAPVRGATLIGKGAEVLMNIDRVGSDLALAEGMCGSESGSIPTSVGQPMIRISSITVGGKA